MDKIRKIIKKKRISIVGLVIRMFLLWLIIAFVLYPNISLLVSIFYQNGQLSLASIEKVLQSERAIKALKNSFWLAVTLVGTVNVVGTLVVLFTEYWEMKGAKFLRLAYMTSLVYGGIVLVAGYKFVYGNQGLLTRGLALFFKNMNRDWFTGYGAVVFIMTFACTTNHIIFLRNAIRSLDFHTIEAAKNMGASTKKILFKVVLPMLKPTYFAITVLIFLTGLSAMSAPLIVGGQEFQTINPMIIRFAKSSYSREIAAVLAIILGLATIIMLLLMNRIEEKGHYLSTGKTQATFKKQPINNRFSKIVAYVVAYLIAVIYLLPIGLVILYSLTDALAIKTATLSLSSFTLSNYRRLFEQQEAFKPYLVSISYSLLASVIVAVLSLVVARIRHKSNRKVDKLFELGMLVPWLLPATLIALGLLFTYDKPNAIIGNNVLVGSTAVLLIGYIVLKLPFSYRMIRAAFFGVNSSYEEAAKSMGAKGLYIFIKVILPIIMPFVISVIVLNFNSLLAEYDLSVFLYNPFLKPLGIVIKSASDETATTNAQAMLFVYSVILIVLSTGALWLTEGNGIHKIRHFKKNKFGD